MLYIQNFGIQEGVFIRFNIFNYVTTKEILSRKFHFFEHILNRRVSTQQINTPSNLNKNTRKRWEICSKLTMKTHLTPMAPMNVLFTFNLGLLSTEYVNKLRIYFTRQWRRRGIFIVNSEHISHLFLRFLLLTLNK